MDRPCFCSEPRAPGDQTGPAEPWDGAASAQARRLVSSSSRKPTTAPQGRSVRAWLFYTPAPGAPIRNRGSSVQDETVSDLEGYHVRFTTKLAACALVVLAGSAFASSHREAPFL